MPNGIRGIVVLTLVTGIVCGCGGERITTSSGSGEQNPPVLSKVAVGDGTRAIVVATVLREDAPVDGATVEFSRAVSGRAPNFQWSGVTDSGGQVRIEIAGSATGYYRARAFLNGTRIGRWSSIPINGGYRSLIDLPIRGKAQVTGEYQLTGLGGEIPIGLVPHLTGRLSSSNPALKNAAELALDEINRSALLGSARIRFIVEDSRSTPEGAVDAFNRLIRRYRVPAIIGPRTSTIAKEAFPIAQANEVVAIGPTSAARGLSAIGDFIFRASLTVDRLIPGGVKITSEKLGYRRVATIFDQADLFSRSSEAVLQDALSDNGIEVLGTETFQSGDTDFSSQLQRLGSLNPDAIFISSQAIEMTELLIQARQLGIPSEVRFLANLVLTVDEIKRAGDAAEGVIAFTAWSSTADTPGNRAFVRNYMAKYGVEPNVFAAQSYATVQILAQALADAQSSDSRAIRDALAKTRNLDTVLGSFSFDANGDGVYNPSVLIVKDGKLEVYDAGTAEQATAIIGESNASGLTGKAVFTRTGDDITFVVELNNASAGQHAVHIHEKGDCSAPDGTSAGGHWNPTGVAHGKWGEGEFHLGDIGNLTASEQGAGRLQLTTNLWEMNTGSDIDVVGKAIVVHAGPDDFVSQPSGNAGARIGCGVIKLGP